MPCNTQAMFKKIALSISKLAVNNCTVKRTRILLLVLLASIFLVVFFVRPFEVNAHAHEEKIWWDDITDVHGAEDPADVWEEILRKREEEDNKTVPDPPGIMTHRDMGLTHFKNVCIVPSDFDKIREDNVFVAPVRAYDSRQLAKPCGIRYNNCTHRFPMDVYWQMKRSFWSVQIFTPEKLDKLGNRNVKTFTDTVAYFPPYWRYRHINMYLLFETTVPTILSQVNESLSLPTANEFRNSRKVLVVSDNLFYENDLVETLKAAAGIEHQISYYQAAKRKRNTILCFPDAIFGNISIHFYFDLVARTLRKFYDLPMDLKGNAECSEGTYALIVQRKTTRKIRNLWTIKQIIGENYGTVKALVFEELSLKEQFEAVQCANIFIGVQGAGLAWYQFLPPNAVLLEIYYRGWVSKYVERAHNSRPDIRAGKVKCKIKIPDETYIKYAEKLLGIKLDPVVNGQMRYILGKQSASLEPIRGNIYKDSDVVCHSKDVMNALRNLTKEEQTWTT